MSIWILNSRKNVELKNMEQISIKSWRMIIPLYRFAHRHFEEKKLFQL